MLRLKNATVLFWFNKAYGSKFEVSLFIFLPFVSVQSSTRIWEDIIVCTR